MDELFEHTKAIYMNEQREAVHFPRPIPFNVIPQIDVFMEDGSTKEEWKMVVETKKILDPAIEVSATCVRVPVFVGHAEAVTIEMEEPLGPDEARAALREAEGVLVVDDPARGEYITPKDCVGEHSVFVSRIRRDPTVPYGLSLWIVADDLRKGAALNAVQIAEALVGDGLLWAHLASRAHVPKARAAQPVDPHQRQADSGLAREEFGQQNAGLREFALPAPRMKI